MISIGDMPVAATPGRAYLAVDLRNAYGHYQPADSMSFPGRAHLAADLRTACAHYQPADNSYLQQAVRCEFEQTIFRIEEGVFLRLREPLELLRNGHDVEVSGWGLRVPVIELDRLDAAVVRYFLLLQGKAERQALSEDEHTAWMHIVDAIDYQRLCADRARPAYAEGTVRTARGDGAVYVEWQDGEREWLPARTAGALTWLRPGDAFGAFVRRDHRGRPTRIEGVASLGEAHTLYSTIPADWPPMLQVAEGDEA